MRTLGGRHASARVMGFTAAILIAAVSLVVTLVRYLPQVPSNTSIPWWVLATGFAAAELFAVHVEFRENAHSFVLSEIPLVLGLMFAHPTGVVVARVLGGLVVIALVRRQAPQKVAFNAALYALDGALAVSVFALVHHLVGQSVIGSWAAVFSATLSANIVAAAAIATVIYLATGQYDSSASRRSAAAGAVTTIATTSLGLVTALQMAANLASLAPISLLAAVLFLGYRGYAALLQRYANLQVLYDFTGALVRSGELDTAVRSALTHARELMRAEKAKLYLLDETGGRSVVVSTENGTLQTEAMTITDDWVWDQVVARGSLVLLSGATRKPAERAYLASHGMKDLLMSPLVHNGAVIGALAVQDREGSVSTFDEEDSKVFETLANHASISIQNSRLIDRLREEIAAKHHQSMHDMLTGLGNRRMFAQRSAEALAAAEISGKGTAVLLLDLDRFKEVNDSLGHSAGDLVLVEVGNRIEAALPPDATVCRLGGDEFAVLLSDVEDNAEPMRCAAAIENALADPMLVHELMVSITAAIGVAIAPDHGDNSTTLLRHADIAMYHSKETRSVTAFDATRGLASERKLALAVELREAIEAGALEVYYQPKACLTSGAVVGAEALLRWDRPGYGPVSPDEFIPIAESAGLMRPLTRLVLERALKQAVAWRDAGTPLSVAVNLSANAVMDRSLPTEIHSLLIEFGLEPHLLTLEITESQVVSDPDRTIKVLEGLHDLGVHVSIDDFGTGYSSLSYLQRLPVQEVKIDKSFVLAMSDAGNAVIVRSVIDLGRNLGLRVVAEGVEDQQTWDRLARLGCDVAQGYLLSKPVPAAAFTAWLARRNTANIVIESVGQSRRTAMASL